MDGESRPAQRLNVRARHISLGLMVAVLVAGCGQSAQTSNGAEATTATESSPNSSAEAGTSDGVGDVCTLLSVEDLASAVGGSWGAPRNVTGGQSVECDYVEDATRTKFFVAIYSDGAITAAGGTDAMLDSLAYPAGADGTEIDAGDGAIFFTFPHVRNFVVMQVGGAVIEMSGESTFGIAFDQESLTTIARTVAGNL